MADLNDRTVEANPNPVGRSVEGGVVGPGGHHVFGRRSRNRARDQPADQEPGNGGVAVGKVKEEPLGFVGRSGVVVLPGPGRLAEPHAGESRQAETVGVLRRHDIDARPEQGVGRRLVERHQRWIESEDPGEVVSVAHPGEAGPLVGLRQPRVGIEPLGREAFQVAACGLRNRGVGGEGLATRRPDDQLVGSKGLLVEEVPIPKPEPAIEPDIVILGIAGHVDPEFPEEPLGHRAVGQRTLDRERAPIPDEGPPLVGKLVPLGVPTEIVVIVENENPGARRGLPVVVCRREPADAGPDDDQIIPLAGRGRHRQPRRQLAITEGVKGLVGSHMGPPKPGQ